MEYRSHVLRRAVLGNARGAFRWNKESKQRDPSGEHVENLDPDFYSYSHDVRWLCNEKQPPPAIAIVGSGAWSRDRVDLLCFAIDVLAGSLLHSRE